MHGFSKWSPQNIRINNALLDYLQVSNGIALSQLDLEDLKSADIGSQSRQALLSTSSHTHQQSVAPRGLKNTVYTAPAPDEEEYVAD